MESSGTRRSRRARRRRTRVWSVLTACAVVGATGAGAVYWQGHARPGAGGAVSSSASAPSGGEASVGTAEPDVDRDALLASAMASVSVPEGAEVSASVLDAGSGGRASYGTGPFDTASIVKVDILAALLLRAQDAHRTLTAAEKTYAVAMIEDSDNDSASALWQEIGQADGLDAANERLGLTDTRGGAGPLWGLTQTTAADQVALLRQVFVADGSELDEASRAYATGLMGKIAEGQRWGVSAAADDGADGSGWALKNGWLRRSTTGLWVVNSVGRVTSGGREYLVAVVSRGSATQAEGVALTEAAARAAVSVFGGTGGDSGVGGGSATGGGGAGSGGGQKAS